MNYYLQKTNKGALNISENVFNTIAISSLEDLANDDLKGILYLKKGKKSFKVTTEINKKNQIKVNCEIFIAEGQEAASACSKVQKALYDDIYEAVEISSLKINVSVLGFVAAK